MIRSYEELLRFETFSDRLSYLRLTSLVGEETFGSRRQVNQDFYHSAEWRSIRRKVILRDDGCNLALPGYRINNGLIVHHINPVTLDDILDNNPMVYDLDNLICVSHDVHNAIHYGNSDNFELTDYVERRPNDTCPWKEA